MQKEQHERHAARARELVAQMTAEEKASQLRYDAPAIPRLGIPASVSYTHLVWRTYRNCCIIELSSSVSTRSS